MEKPVYNLAIIEDQPPVLESLYLYFSNSEQFKLIATASNMEELVTNCNFEQLDILLCDIGLPIRNGIEVTWHVKKKVPHAQIVMFTVFDDREHVFQALCAGASGYLLKSTPLALMEQQLFEVLQGGSVMSPQVARLVFEHFNPALKHRNKSLLEQLTPREVEIVALLQQGASYKLVAEKIFISVDTVKYHIRNIYTKLQVNSKAELMLRYK